MTIAAQTMTLDEFLEHHEHDPILEYEHGVVTEKMPPAWNHGIVGWFVSRWINDFTLPRKLAFAIPELRTTDLESGVSRVPDVSVYLWDRIERDPKRQQRGAFIPPDI